MEEGLGGVELLGQDIGAVARAGLASFLMANQLAFACYSAVENNDQDLGAFYGPACYYQDDKFVHKASLQIGCNR